MDSIVVNGSSWHKSAIVGFTKTAFVSLHMKDIDVYGKLTKQHKRKALCEVYDILKSVS